MTYCLQQCIKLFCKDCSVLIIKRYLACIVIDLLKISYISQRNHLN